MTTSITRTVLLTLVILSHFSAYGEEKQQENLPAHPTEQDKENPRDGDDTLKFYLGKSGSVVSGTFKFVWGVRDNTTSYTGSFHVKDTLYGPKPSKQDIFLNLGDFAGHNDLPKFIEDGSECIVFLEHQHEGKDENIWNTIDIWSGVQPYRHELEFAIKRVAQKADFLKPSEKDRLRHEYATDSPDELLKRLATLESELKKLRTQALPFKTLVKLHVSLYLNGYDDVDPVNQLPKPLIQFLGLNEAEGKALGAIVGTSREQIIAEIAKQKPTTEKTADGYRLAIAEFSDSGKNIESTFLRQAVEVLGTDRLHLMLHSIMFNKEGWFFKFGKEHSTYTFTKPGRFWVVHYPGGYSELQSSLKAYPLLKPYLPDELVNDIEKGAMEPTPDKDSKF